MVHLAIANLAYFRALGILPVPDSLPMDRNVIAKQINQADKAAVRRYVAESFDYVATVLDKMTEKDLTRKDVNFGRNPHSGTDVLFRAYMHTAHHRGQTVVYLRVKGMVPPTWNSEQRVRHYVDLLSRGTVPTAVASTIFSRCRALNRDNTSHDH